MAQATLRGEETSARFFLDSEGRVDVDTVLLSLGARLVKLDDGDGCFSVLERNPSGKSLNVFQPGQIVNVLEIVKQQQPQPQPQEQQQSWVGAQALLSRFILDVDAPSMFFDCEYVQEIDLRVHVSTKVFIWSEFKSGELTKDYDPQVKLVGCDPVPVYGPGWDDGWDEMYSGPQHLEHVQKIESWLGLPSDTGFRWLTDGRKCDVKKLFDGRIAIGSKNNEVLADASLGPVSAVLGVNVYKRLSWTAILRAHLEFLLWGLTSELPFMQLLTDMCTEGLFYVCNEELAGKSVLWIVVMEDMDEVKEVFQSFGKSLPKSVNAFSEAQRLEFKTLPHRAKFPYKGAKRPPVTAAFAW